MCSLPKFRAFWTYSVTQEPSLQVSAVQAESRGRHTEALSVERNQKLADCQLPASVKTEKLLHESAAAYHALNAQLLAELPAFLHAVETFVGLRPKCPIST